MTTSTEFAASLLHSALWIAHKIPAGVSCGRDLLGDILGEISSDGIILDEVKDDVRDLIGLMVESEDDLWVITILEEYGVKIPGEWYK